MTLQSTRLRLAGVKAVAAVVLDFLDQQAQQN
jgi:hypothetical protein